MYQAVQDSVGEGWILQPGMPVFQRSWTGKQRGTVSNAIVDDF